MSQTTTGSLDADSQTALAKALYNRVWELLEKSDRTAADDEELVHTAHASRHFWTAVGTEKNRSIGDWQVSRVYSTLERGSQWDKGKGCDTFGPLGPWLVTRDDIPNPQKLAMWLDLNGKRVQTGNTKTMIFSVAKIVSHLSQYMTLMPGDVITTGTPPGVGLGMKPPVYLKKGDVMTLGIEGLGEQRQVVVPFKL